MKGSGLDCLSIIKVIGELANIETLLQIETIEFKRVTVLVTSYPRFK